MSEIYIKDYIQQPVEKQLKGTIILESPMEIKKDIIGAKIMNISILSGKDAYCVYDEKNPNNTDEELFIEFTNGKEMRIYIDEDGRLCVYTD